MYKKLFLSIIFTFFLFTLFGCFVGSITKAQFDELLDKSALTSYYSDKFDIDNVPSKYRSLMNFKEEDLKDLKEAKSKVKKAIELVAAFSSDIYKKPIVIHSFADSSASLSYKRKVMNKCKEMKQIFIDLGFTNVNIYIGDYK